jgi:hypothetical protein
MKKNIYFTLLLVAFAIILTGCSNEPEVAAIDAVRNPALLIYPKSSIGCEELNATAVSAGNNVDAQIDFVWEDVEYADTYQFILKNETTGEITEKNISSTNFSILVDKRTQYSWTVRSVSYDDNIAIPSEEVNFYVQSGLEVSNPPYRAKALSPKRGSHLTANSINLNWIADDADEDIVSYEVYMDNSFPPTTKILTTTGTSTNVSLGVDDIYFWKVKTIDSRGNTSHSEVFQFRKI